MQGVFEIKGVAFGAGRPVICIPVMEADRETIIKKITDLAARGAQMIEWRADAFSEVEDADAVKTVLEAVKPYLEKTVFLYTFRTKKQGGTRALEEKKIIYMNETAAKSGAVDMVDLEFFEAVKPLKGIRRLQGMGVRVIASHHDFDHTPDSRILRMLMDQMKEGGADIAKIAVMPQSADDVLRLLKLTVDTRKKYPDLPLVTMSMGSAGVISRICGETFGSCITFGADGAGSAPGQLQADDLAQILDTLHASIG